MTEPLTPIGTDPKTAPSAQVPEGGGAWLRAVIGIVASPRVSFEIIRQDRPWVGVLALLVFATIVQSLLMRPVSAMRFPLRRTWV